MKTFETEKHNIPEGATHYFNEDHFNYFTWVAVDSFGNCWGLIEKSEVTGGIKPIPQANIEAPEEKDVEWVNGEPLEYKDEDDEWEHSGRYVCFDGYGKHHVFTARDGMMYHASDEQIRKSETEAERVEREREREDAINEMSLIVESGNGFAGNAYKKYCASLYDAGYRKES